MNFDPAPASPTQHESDAPERGYIDDYYRSPGEWDLSGDRRVGQGTGTSPSSDAEDSRPPL